MAAGPVARVAIRLSVADAARRLLFGYIIAGPVGIGFLFLVAGVLLASCLEISALVPSSLSTRKKMGRGQTTDLCGEGNQGNLETSENMGR